MRCIALLLLLVVGPARSADPVHVAVAANFRTTLEQINGIFEEKTGYRVTVSAGATGVLYNQIVHGAPYDLFFSADRDAPARLEVSAGLESARPSFCYASGRLVLAGGSGALAQLGDPNLSLAIANPVTAPYGVAAMSVLARDEFRAGDARKLVRGANVMQAYQFWHSGAVALALLPRSLVPEGTLVPRHWHGSLEQYAIALKSPTGRPALTAYLDWIRSDTVRTLITEAGYEPCP